MKSLPFAIDGQVEGVVIASATNNECGLVTKPPVKAEGKWVYTRQEIWELLGKFVPAGALRKKEDFDDGYYYLPSRNEVNDVFDRRSALVAATIRVDDLFDCDDFAYLLKSDYSLYRFRHNNHPTVHVPFAVGMIMGGPASRRHYANIAVTSDEEVLVVDSTVTRAGISAITEWEGSIDYVVI